MINLTLFEKATGRCYGWCAASDRLLAVIRKLSNETCNNMVTNAAANDAYVTLKQLDINNNRRMRVFRFQCTV